MTSMSMSRPPFLLPVENQVRELDAKLLLAALAAARGHECYLGWKGSLEQAIETLPQGIFFAKSMTPRTVFAFRVLRLLGQKIVATDEEAVVHYGPAFYHGRRLHPTAMALTDRLFAWGEDNRELWTSYPQYRGTPIHITGNPRVDLLRPEFRAFFDERVAALRRTYGRYILINTSFGTINGFSPEMNLANPKPGGRDGLELARAAQGLPEAAARALYGYRTALFRAFQNLVPRVAEAFPERTVILRPHPAENRAFWHDRLKAHRNVRVTGEGNVVPWLLAADVLVHNGCTTAVEGHLLERPVIAFTPLTDPRFDLKLPNALSVACATPEAVIEEIAAVLSGGRSARRCLERDAQLDRFIAALRGRFAAARILDAVEEDLSLTRRGASGRLAGGLLSGVRRGVRAVQRMKSRGRHGSGFKEQRYPAVTPERLQRDVERLLRLGGADARVVVSAAGRDLFRLAPA